MRRNQATVTKEVNLEDKTEQKFHRLIVIFIIIHVLLLCWRSNQLAAKKGLKFCELAWARRTEKKFDFSEYRMLWRPAVGWQGGEGCFFSFSRLPSQYFPSSLFLFVLSPLFGYRHIHYGIKSLYDYVKTRNTSQTSLHWIHLRHECNFETVELCKFCLHYTTEHSQRLRHGRVGQLGPRYILIVTMSLQQSG